MKRLFFVITIFLLSLFTITVSADTCTNEEKARLKKEAAKVKLVYEEAEELVEPTEAAKRDGATAPLADYYFNMRLINVSDKMNVRVRNDYNETIITALGVDVSNNGGTYEFEWRNISNIIKFTYEVVGSASSNCPSETLFTGYLVTPKYNSMSRAGICKDISDYKYCAKFITFDISREDMYNQIEEYKATLEESNNNNKTALGLISDFVASHKTLAILSITGIAIAGVGFVVIRSNRKKVK